MLYCTWHSERLSCILCGQRHRRYIRFIQVSDLLRYIIICVPFPKTQTRTLHSLRFRFRFHFHFQMLAVHVGFQQLSVAEFRRIGRTTVTCESTARGNNVRNYIMATTENTSRHRHRISHLFAEIGQWHRIQCGGERPSADHFGKSRTGHTLRSVYRFNECSWQRWTIATSCVADNARGTRTHTHIIYA